MTIAEIGTGYTEIPAKIGAATEIVAYNLFLSFPKTLGNHSELIDITFRTDVRKETNIRRIYIPEKYQTVDDKGSIHVIRRLLYSWKLALFLRRLLKNSRTEIILHFHNQFNFCLFYFLNKKRLKKSMARTAFTVHSSSWSFAGKVPRNLLLEKYAIKKADHVIAITKAIKHNILIHEPGADKTFADKIFCIHNGVNTETYYPIEGVEKKNRFINIGSVCNRKDQLGTIRMLTGVLKEYNYEFVFAGKIIEPEYLQQIETYVRDNDLSTHVKYLGEIEPGPELNRVYNESKAYISSSKKEAGLSLVVLEALSAGLPVVLTRSFDVSLADFSNTPSSVNTTDEHTIQNDLQKIIQANAHQLSEMAAISRQFVQENLSWDAIAIQHINAFNYRSA